MDRFEIIFTFIMVISLAIGQGLLSSFVLLLAAKWGLLEKYDIYRAKWMPQRCEFCTSFWLSVCMMSTYIYLNEFNIWYLFVPPMAATINFLILKGE